ncbi:autolysin [Achaetomium macrosporum]|uniref:Autolysin n=1 Tax=Achaetomium macrosporum TaxID=79813 RepID=A0AAN7CEV0_9PEZI|nr:autolysin [Achaetomium macrosporum]
MSYQDNNGYGGGYPQGNPPPYGQGESASYYAGAQQPQQYPLQGQSGYGQPSQGPSQDGPEGERGFLGAVGGGVAGAWGGHKIGGKTGHSTLTTVLGAVAGAVAGHKLQDGVSEWKDKRDEEKERKEREEEERRHHHHNHRHSRSPSPAHRHESHQQSRDMGGVSYAGNFSSSSQDIRLDAHGEYMLHASCRRVDGSYQSSSISLNQIIENDQGSFRWASSGRRDHGHSRPREVTVQPGDTLRSIAAQVGTSFEEIARHNGIQNPDLIYPGQVLQVPGGAGGGWGGSVGNFAASARDVRLADGGRRLEGELRHPDGHWVGSSIMLDERIGNDNGTLTFVQL